MSRVEPERNRYVGHRYVPKIFGEWDKQNQYEGLSIVTHQGTSYTSKKRVPVGIDILNEEFWVVTGNYNAQVEHYRDEVRKLSDDVTDIDNKLNDKSDKTYVDTELSKKSDKTYVDTELGKKANKTYVDTELSKKSDKTYVDTELNNKPDATIKSVTLNVSPDGNDNNSGDSLNPLKTVKKAVDQIPDIIKEGHIYKIVLDTGIFNEDLTLKNITIQGELIIEGSTDNRQNHKVRRLRADKLIGHATFKNITTTLKDGSGASFWFTKCAPYMQVSNVEVESDPEIEKTNEGSIGLLADHGSNVFVTGSDFSGKRYGIRSNYLSKIFSSRNTGDNNNFGIGARWGGILSTYESQPTGSTSQTASSSGIIMSGRGDYFGLPMDDLYLVDRTRDGQDGRFYKKIYNISSIKARNVEIEPGQSIKLTLRALSHGAHNIKIKYGGQRSTVGYSEFIEANWTGTINSSNVQTDNLNVLYANVINESSVSVAHKGSGNELIITITPTSAVIGRWAVEIESQIMRSQSAPDLVDVEII